MGDRERLFFALWPDEALQTRLARQMRSALRAGGGRIIPAQNLHVTLLFLGAIEIGQRQCIEQRAGSLQARPFTLSLQDWEYWKRPRIVGCTVAGTPDALRELVAGLRRIGRDCGVEVESRPYVPHLTVMRKAQRAPGVALEGPLSWPVQDFHLVRSQTHPDGARYDRVRTWRLSDY